jgi:hypothetical protein
MKKQVRIRKALPGETPGYYNKTAKYLKKAAMGMEVSSSGNDENRMNQIYDNVYIALKNDDAPDLVFNNLIYQYGLDSNTANSIINAAMSRLSEEGYIDPEIVTPKEDPNEPQVDPQAQAAEEEERNASDAEQEELAQSNDIYRQEEEAMMNDRSHLETEEDEQQQAFRYGGYYDEGGEYTDEEEVSDESSLMDQYEYPGNIKLEKPFSIEDLIAITPGMQGQTDFPDLASYIGNYQPIFDPYEQQYLQQAQSGGLIKAQSGLQKALEPALKPFVKGWDYVNKKNPLQNVSAIRRAAPVLSLFGEAATKIPYFGKKMVPKLNTPYTQNRTELWNVLNGAKPKLGVFSQAGTRSGEDNALHVDRLLLQKDDVNSIISKIYDNPDVEIKLKDVLPDLERDNGLIGGIYPLNSKVKSGIDDQGNTYFEIEKTFKPNEKLPFGTTPKKAKETTFKNRFYYSVNPETNDFNVFDQTGNPLTEGTQTMYDVDKSFLKKMVETVPALKDLALKGSMNSFPNYIMSGERGIKPQTVDDLGFVRKKLEGFTTSFGNRLVRPSEKEITKLDIPVLGYANPALGAAVRNPATIPYAETIADMKNAMNYKSRLGLKASLIGGLGLYIGYNTYDAYAHPCQCTDPNTKGYIPLDETKRCPCETDLPPNALMRPTPVPKQLELIESTTPDSMNFIINGGKDEENYYRNNSGQNNPNIENQYVPNDFANGGVTKNRFIKRMTTMYQEGGSSEKTNLGAGNRKDNLTNDVSKMKTSFINTLKNNSNKALSGELYKNAQNDPEILNMLMQGNPTENLAEDAFKTNPLKIDPTAEYGGYVNMDVENPLTRFMQGGDETSYYEPDLYQAQFGFNNIFKKKTPATQGQPLEGDPKTIFGFTPTPMDVQENEPQMYPPDAAPFSQGLNYAQSNSAIDPRFQDSEEEVAQKMKRDAGTLPDTSNMSMKPINPEEELNKFNSRMRGFLGRVDQRQRSKNEINQILDTTDPMNIYASNNDMDKGDWNDVGSKSGLFRYNQMGSDRNSRATFGNYATAKNGGYMAQGGTYQDDEEVYMSPEELEQFLAAGGQVEYL